MKLKLPFRNRHTETFVQTSLSAQVLRGAAGSFAIKALNSALTFLLAVVLARQLDPAGYGLYTFALAIIMLAAIPAQVGIPQLVVRETAKQYANHDWATMKGLWRWANSSVFIFSTLGALGVGAALFLTAQSFIEDKISIITIGVALIPLVALSNVRSACLRGLNHVVLGQFPEGLLRPALMLSALLLISHSQTFEFKTTAENVMILHVAATLLAFVFGALILWRKRPIQITPPHTPNYQRQSWRRAALPLAFVSGLELINNYADILILGLFHSDSEVGIYKATSQVALLVVFGLQALNQVLHPYFARLHAQDERAQLQQLVTLSSRIILALAAAPFLVFALAGSDVLTLVFGNPYSAGATALTILAFGQLANAGFGSVGALLNMTGHERDTLKGMLMAMVTNLVLNFLLIPRYGMEGAAIATAVSLIVWNAVLRYYVKQRLAIESSAFGQLHKHD